MKFIKKIKAWYKKTFNFWRRFSDELDKRKDEVIHRALSVCNRTFPDELLEQPFDTMIEWIIEPHIKKIYTPFIYIDSNEDRGAERAVLKIMELREKLGKQKETTETE